MVTLKDKWAELIRFEKIPSEIILTLEVNAELQTAISSGANRKWSLGTELSNY